MSANNITAIAVGVGIALAFPGALLAQDTVEEIVVTATKRAVALEDLVGAANVIGSDQLGPGGIESVRDMIAQIPSLSIGDQFGFARVFMRGIGMTSIDIGGEGAVSFLQDGAIIPRPAAQLMGMFDLQQVEVLRGPQGTLYGRGATAGAINMVTNKPGKEVGGYANFTAGNFGLLGFEGAVDVPVSPELSLRFATKLENRDGYGTNRFSGADVDDRDAQAFRVIASYDPDTTWDATFSAQYYKEDDNNYAFHYFGPSAGTSGPTPLAVPILGGRTVSDVGGDIYDINSDQEAINDRDGYLVNLIMNFDLTENTSMRSVTSFQNMDRFLRDDLDSTDVNLFGQNNYTEESDSFGQEFTFNYNSGNLDVLAGVMYFQEDLYGQVLVPLTNLCFLLAPAVCGTPAGDALGAGRYEQNGDIDITAYGAFVEGTYAINDQWSVIGGLRYNYEEREGTGFFVFDALGVDLATNQKKDWDDITPRVTVQYRPNDYMMLYATYNEAFKSGVINTGSLSPALDPETVDAFEFGVKGSSQSGALKYSVALFSYDYKDLQISFVDETSTVSTINAAEAENYGAEVELSADLGNGFGLDFFATLLSAEYKDFINGDYANGFALTNLNGNTLPNAPESSAKIGLTYQTEMDNGMLTVRGEVFHQDDVYFTEWNRPDAFQEAYQLVNASVNYEFANSAWSATLWARNLADEEIISNNIITAPLYDSLRVGSVLPPRTVGLSLNYRF